MRLIIISIPLLLLLTLTAIGQNDPEAFRILDNFSATALRAPSVSMKFKLITIDQMENKNDTLPGSIILSKDKYKLDLPDNIIWFNGETSSSYLPAENEVTITKPDKKDNSFQNRPSAIFSMYKKGYKNRLIEEKPDFYLIDLYPEDIKSDLLRIRLSIGKNPLVLKSLEYKKRDGIVVTLQVSEYNLKVKPEADTFMFRREKYKGVEIVDMR
ncbi:MAG: outer membrane lipoprotein carrier protein LolA [Bacteroidetes bacterium]|nr:MAG: outer membrane lipoprotein carrier protein LolA [Bacteroidota bacterium]